MANHNETIDMAHQNTAARERGASVAREYDRVVSTFNKVLEFKEKVRLSLENCIIELKSQLNNNADKLDTLDRNVQIYDVNVDKIANNLEDMLAEETRIKDKYNLLLQGASMEMVGVNTGDDAVFENDSTGIESSPADLMQKRNQYLDGLNSSFHKLDEDLESISCLRTEILSTRTEIFQKKEQALQMKTTIEAHGRCLREELEKVESDLKVSIDEESILTHEYSNIINKIEGCIVLSEDIDRVLFSSLTAVHENIE